MEIQTRYAPWSSNASLIFGVHKICEKKWQPFKVIMKLAKWESLHSKDDMRNEESSFFGKQNIYYGCEIRFLMFSYDEGKNPLLISYYMQWCNVL